MGELADDKLLERDQLHKILEAEAWLFHEEFALAGNELDGFAKKKATQRDRPKGQVYSDADLNITVWVKEWAEVINDARARLQFVNEQLSYEADRDSAKAYLKRTHAKFIPEFDDVAEAGDEDVFNMEASS